MPQVQILSQFPTSNIAPDGTVQDVLAVVYSSETVPPRTVYVPGKQPTEKEIAAAIRADLDSVQPPPSMEV